MRMLARVFAASIWAPGAIPADEWKFRNLNDFIVLMLAFSLPFPLSRLNLLGEEIKERRVPA